MSNFMSNSDALQVLGTYAEDIKKGKGVIAVRETSPATAAHGVGEYIRYNGTTYKVKSAISIGDSLILNTNIEANGLPNGTTIFTPETVGDPTVAYLDDLGDVDISNPQNGQVPTYNSTSGKFENAAIPQDSTKADKVSSATNGDFAALDSNGNLTDSGKKASDFVASTAVGTAAAKNVPASGNASSTEVVLGSDTRLSNARSANGGIADNMRSLNSAGQSHGNSWLLTDKHNVNGDGYFYLYTGDDSVKTSVYKANIVPAAGVQAGWTPSWLCVTSDASGNAQVRNILFGTTDATAGSSALNTGFIYLVYE